MVDNEIIIFSKICDSDEMLAVQTWLNANWDDEGVNWSFKIYEEIYILYIDPTLLTDEQIIEFKLRWL